MNENMNDNTSGAPEYAKKIAFSKKVVAGICCTFAAALIACIVGVFLTTPSVNTKVNEIAAAVENQEIADEQSASNTKVEPVKDVEDIEEPEPVGEEAESVKENESTASGGSSSNAAGNMANSNASSGSVSKPNNSSASNSNSNSNTSVYPQAHEHSWTYHEAVTEQVWVSNNVYIPRYTCGHCGTHTYTPEAAYAHQEAEGLETGTFYAYYTNGYYEDRGYYETQTVKDAYYSCSCGATK